MISEIRFKHYRKLIDLTIDFKEGINIISGTNGTCKTSILHIISNTFQKVTSTADWLEKNNCLKTISALNTSNNPKIESLTRGGKLYNDPAPNIKGVLYEVEFSDKKVFRFRRHNTKSEHRFALKPTYPKGKRESLPAALVLYLGLSRLFPFGEFNQDEDISTIFRSLPDNYMESLASTYKLWTGCNPIKIAQEKIGLIKKRPEFLTDIDGVDSNTISDGEDNLFGLLFALESLRYFHDSITDPNKNNYSSYLIVDEIDATLHPDLQIRILNRTREYCQKYAIQAFFTTHSLPLIEDALRKKDNVIYLVNNETKVDILPEPTMFKINKHLAYQSDDKKYLDKKITILSEDSEARLFLVQLFEYFKQHNEDFAKVDSYFHIPDICFGAEDLIKLFQNEIVFKNTATIGLLDGDKTDSIKKSLRNNLLVLPGKKSPEDVLYEYSKKLYLEDTQFWSSNPVLDSEMSKEIYRLNILDFQDQIDECENEKKHREIMKNHFNEYKEFYRLVLIHWIHNKDNFSEISNFFINLRSLYKKLCPIVGLNKALWGDSDLQADN